MVTYCGAADVCISLCSVAGFGISSPIGWRSKAKVQAAATGRMTARQAT